MKKKSSEHLGLCRMLYLTNYAANLIWIVWRKNEGSSFQLNDFYRIAERCWIRPRAISPVSNTNTPIFSKICFSRFTWNYIRQLNAFTVQKTVTDYEFLRIYSYLNTSIISIWHQNKSQRKRNDGCEERILDRDANPNGYHQHNQSKQREKPYNSLNEFSSRNPFRI